MKNKKAEETIKMCKILRAIVIANLDMKYVHLRNIEYTENGEYDVLIEGVVDIDEINKIREAICDNDFSMLISGDEEDTLMLSFLNPNKEKCEEWINKNK